jgi:group I intron endonuclease
MSIGIYALHFNELFYIGKSNNLDRRKKDHLTSLYKGAANYKLLKAFSEYGEPNFIVIEYCSIEELNSKEIFWIKEFDSVNNGLNISQGGDGGGSGIQHNRAIHSEDTICEVFKLLISPELYTYKDIFELTNVSISTITNIVEHSAHIWLKNKFFDSYYLLDDFKNARRSKALLKRADTIKGISKDSFNYPSIKDPQGNVYSSITNAKQFSEQHNLSKEGLCRLFSGKIKSHRKWTLA